MAFFETLGNRAFGVDDSWGPLRVAREHDPDMRLVRANALHTPFRDGTFDAAFSSYVAEHFEDGPEELFREIHRVLKPGGLFFVVVPFNNTFRRFVVNPTLRAFYALWKLRGKAPRLHRVPLHARRRWTASSRAPTSRCCASQPDDYFLPWTKGLFVDLCDVGSFVHYEHKPPYEFGRFGVSASSRIIQSVGLWHSCDGHLLRGARPEVSAGQRSPRRSRGRGRSRRPSHRPRATSSTCVV